MKSIFSSRALWSAGVLAVVAAGCAKQGTVEKGASSNGTQSNAGASSPNELVLISPHSADIQYEFEQAFKAKNPDVKFRWLDQGGSSNVLRSIEGDFQGKTANEGIGVDVIFGGGAET